MRHGDSISPYLFIIVMEVLSKLLDKAAALGSIIKHPKCSSPSITHLLFGDDLLVFSDGSQKSLLGTAEVLRKFKLLSGLDMNAAKSGILFGGYTVAEAAELSNISGVQIGSFPTR